jgi:hypothetical protein
MLSIAPVSCPPFYLNPNSLGKPFANNLSVPLYCSNREEVGYYPILNIQPIAYLTSMKNRIFVNCVAMSALALSFILVGCDRQVSSEKTSTVSSDGTVKSKEKTVTQSSDGTVTKTEESKKTTPPAKP